MAYEPPDFYEFEVSPDFTAPSTTPFSPPPSGLVYSDPTAALKTALMTGAVVSFIVLIAKDAHRAVVTRAHWIPCDFLVLSAFSVQLLSLLNAQNQAAGTTTPAPPAGHWVIRDRSGGNVLTTNPKLWQDFLSIHNSRSILCVFAAYVMPAMADHGLEHAWVRWVALVITVFHHVSSEFYIVKDDNKDFPNVIRLWPRQLNKRGPQYYVYATIISLCFILLILLLACANIAGKSIERIVAKKISVVLKGEGEFCDGLAEKTQEARPHHHAHHHSCWRTVKSDVNRVDHRDPLHHAHDHSCLREVEGAVLRAGQGNENHHHYCWRTVEEAIMRVEKREEEDHHSCWQTIEDALVRGEKAEVEHHRRHCHNCWRTVEDSVLKAWIIVRAYSTQPVIARSALTASAAIIVTLQIAITIVGGLAKDVKDRDKNEHISFNFKLIASILQSVFILLAWVLINLRWGIAAAYHTRSQADSWRNDLRIEDFWTRYLRELQEVGESRPGQARLIDNKIEQLVSKEPITVKVPSILLYTAFGMQWFLVSFSKVCWLTSLMIFHNKLMVWLYSFMFGKHIMYVFEDYPKYRKILEDVQMLGETPESLWVANRNSIVKAKSLTIQGNQDGECNCEDLVDFLSNKKTDKGLGLSCLYPHKPQTGLKFLCKKRPIQRTSQPQGEAGVEEQFTGLSKKSWKMTAVSLLSIIVHLSTFNGEVDKEHCSTSQAFPPEAVKDCLKAYSQAWEIIDFVEETDTEADGITSEAADKYFQALQKKVDKADFTPKDLRPATPKWVRAALEELKKESKSKIEPLESVNVVSGEKQECPKGWEGNDSIDWKAAASSLAVYNLCNSIEFNDGTDVSELLKELESSLADIINECFERVQDLLLLNSRKWALSRDERLLGKALYTAGKAKVIMEKLVWNKVAIVSYH
ncbi:hypothetical protein SUGI_0850190 [Cryptomeria japonica]|nr:hypothetical protein SUGI_0850190 [Cryptomeria japonica]